VAKYYNERVCACLCVGPRAYLPNYMRDLYRFLCMLNVAVARSSSSGVTKSQEEGAILGVFFPIDNALYSIAFGTHTKTVEPFEMLFGLMTRVGPWYHVNTWYQGPTRWGTRSPKEKGNFGGNVAANCTPSQSRYSIYQPRRDARLS